ncbi:hypothetical protein VNI00_018679 [Paramarasmius palmivorus]|uniref:Uncharacterized protein n=1 Tax=Paramarasmius palmivorus TaxID=297713 RepID=A0AAW0AV56_9AGAR
MSRQPSPETVPTTAQWTDFISASIPVHQELFNRIVALYPRTQSGLLDSLEGLSGRDKLETEMYLLRNIAEYPIMMQRRSPATPMLTAQFQQNIKLIVDTILSVLPSNRNPEDVVSSVSCPPTTNAPEKNMNNIPTLCLWAAEVTRLKSYLKQHTERPVDAEANAYHTATLQWLKGIVAKKLCLPPISDSNINAAADRLLQSVP